MGFQVRCVYRVCEFAEGMDGYAFSTEWLFWVFEALSMVGAIGVFVVFHPSRFLGKDGADFRKEMPARSGQRDGDAKSKWFRGKESESGPV